MSEVKHTPGPLCVWGQQSKTEIGGFYVIGQSDYKGASVAYVAHKADAELYTAAPDLYSELDMQVRNCPVCRGEGMAVDVFDILTNEPPHEKTPCNRCASSRAALAKAEGRTP